MSPFWEGLLAGYGIAVPVGAVAVLILHTAIRCGLAVGLCAGAGAATADLLYAILAAIAGTAISAALAPIAVPLRIVGGLVLVALALSGLRRARRQAGPPEANTTACAALPTYLRFLGLTLLNPMTVIYFTAFMLGREPTAARQSMASSLSFVAGVGLASLSWQSLLAGLGGLARYRLSARLRQLAVVLGNLLVLALGMRMLILALL